VEDDGGGRDEDEENSKPSLVSSSALTGSDLGQEIVQEEATTHRDIPLGCMRAKLEPDY
jgi:hypothetical protein